MAFYAGPSGETTLENQGAAALGDFGQAVVQFDVNFRVFLDILAKSEDIKPAFLGHGAENLAGIDMPDAKALSQQLGDRGLAGTGRPGDGDETVHS